MEKNERSSNHSKLKRELSQRYGFKDADPTLNFFYKPHTISALVIMLFIFLYVSLYITDSTDSVLNIKIGLTAVCMCFILMGILMFHDGPFIRPHPAFWRAVLACGTLYQLMLVFLLFQTVSDARNFFKFFDDSLGVPLPEKSYADNCEFSGENIWNQVDIFVIAHALGWFGKAIILRDHYICWILSIMFEVLEYSLQHQLPNFAECWWDHWLLDVFGCNWLGIFVGMKFCEYLELKQYSWSGFSQIHSYTGKMKRALGQLTPHSWTKFEWSATKNFNHFAVVMIVSSIFLMGEVNAFYLKYLLWIPPNNLLNVYRLVLMFFAAVCAVRETYEYLTNPMCKRLGAHAWVTIGNVLTEAILILKFGKNEFEEPTPPHVIFFWTVFSMIILLYCILQFVLVPFFTHHNKEKEL